MKFSELVRLLEKNGFHVSERERFDSLLWQARARQVGSRGLSWFKGNSNWHLSCYYEGRWHQRKSMRKFMIDLKYSLIIEATSDPNFFGFFSRELEGFTGIGHSIEDC